MSEKQTFTLPDGRRIEVPRMSDDLAGYGARTEDTRCVRCGEEFDLIHRTDIASCIGKCHVCKLEDHPGEVRQTVTCLLHLQRRVYEEHYHSLRAKQQRAVTIPVPSVQQMLLLFTTDAF
jgi:hypothetical protein